MKVINKNFFRDPKAPEDVNVLRNLIHEHITSQPQGKVAFGWSMNQCGSSVWYDCKGYIETPEGPACVTMRYTWL
jgi:hypothetical protein